MIYRETTSSTLTPQNRLTPAELARRVRQLEITTRRAVTEVFAGEYSSAFKGRGIEFADVREYQPGDDIRTIDWNVTARAGKPYVKRFTEERELTIMLAVDLSASGRFSSTGLSKQELAVEASAVLAFAAARKGDRVGLLIFTDRVELFIPPRKGPQHTLRLIRELLAFEPTHTGTDLSAVGDHLAMVLRRRSVVFVVSDLLGVGIDVEHDLRHVSSRHELISVRIADPREAELPDAGLMCLTDPESGNIVTVDTSSQRVRDAYRRTMQGIRERQQRSLARIGADRLDLSTQGEYLHELVGFFRKRERSGGGRGTR